MTTLGSPRVLVAILAVIALSVAAVSVGRPLSPATATGPGNTISVPDDGGAVGTYTSLALDGTGRPAVSYYNLTNGDLNVLHCDDQNCSGGNESINAPDTEGNVGLYTSLALDDLGKPVVSYWDQSNGDLKLLHCGNILCSLGNNITAPDTTGTVGSYTSLALDGSGNPVVSYWDQSNGDLRLLHCGNANCTSGNSITSPDTAGSVGQYTSLALDASGNPVVSYRDVTNGDLKLLHCGNANCTSGNSVTAPDTAGNVGFFTSLALDASGNPVVSYQDRANRDLKVLHCNDPDCSGGDESTESPDTDGNVGWHTSLALDGSGNPVVSYFDETNFDLKVLHCNDPNCNGGDESITSPDANDDAGEYTSLALDSSGDPVISYYDFTNNDLNVLHCNDVDCGGDESVTMPATGDQVGEHTSLSLDASGNPVVSYRDRTIGDLKLLHCGNAACTSGNSITSPDNAGSVGQYTSLALDSSGHPVVSYYDTTNGDLKLLHCNDPNCAGGNESVTRPDAGGNVGRYTSLELDGSGNPVVSYYDSTNGDLKLLHCNDPNCSGGDESITSPDSGGDVGEHTSLALDASGNPVVSYNDFTNRDLKLLHCNDPNCSGGDESITAPDTGGEVGRYTSLALDASGNPVVSYEDRANRDLKLMHCNDPNCSGGDESITSPDTTGSVGTFTSLALDASGNPVVSYRAVTNRHLKVLLCNDANCSGGDESITAPDSAGTYTSLALDASGNPVVSYYDVANGDLNVLHCGGADCTGLKATQTPTVTDTPPTATLAVSVTPTETPPLVSPTPTATTPPFTPTTTPTATATTAAPTATPTTAPCPVADVNRDGNVNSIDALFVLQLVAGLIGSLPCQDAADVNEDGTINSIDAALILQSVAGLI